MISFLIKVIIIKDSKFFGGHNVYDTQILIWVMLWVCIKILFNVASHGVDFLNTWWKSVPYWFTVTFTWRNGILSLSSISMANYIIYFNSLFKWWTSLSNSSLPCDHITWYYKCAISKISVWKDTSLWFYFESIPWRGFPLFRIVVNSWLLC